MRHDGSDRRRYPRSKRAVHAVMDGGGPGVLNHIDNISANGVLCHTVRPIPLMTRMSIAIELPKPLNQRIECEGVVVRCEPHEKGDDHFKVAILYTRISDECRQAIHEFVESDLADATGD
ncbi:MAG TPA: PilZ domain-containing protein [Candidatus Hydrogenedentes bacterium]|nr:PilZ domain-containing protein [Candidatus Hydrogenedentota bacterium]HOS02799.1 PilZ domain-containing protein [Candidatus Hydrogenedentota bacterium]